jgi:DNA-binding response OmpR family regulator
MVEAKILYVEDDEVLSFVTKDNLELQGFTVEHFDNGLGALKAFERDDYDLCVLDVMLPEMDGFSLAKEIRAMDSAIPILFLTAKSLKEDKIKGLKLGADDYITKPYSIEELILKIKIFLRRKNVLQNVKTFAYSVGKYDFDAKNLKLKLDSEERNLTHRECELLKLLIENKNDIVERSLILKKIWGEDDYFLGRSLDVFISRLRKYLKEDTNIKIENIHSVGFRLKVES